MAGHLYWIGLYLIKWTLNAPAMYPLYIVYSGYIVGARKSVQLVNQPKKPLINQYTVPAVISFLFDVDYLDVKTPKGLNVSWNDMKWNDNLDKLPETWT